MSFFSPIDIYCERLDASFWAEPFNAISNISIFLAGVFGFRHTWRLSPSTARTHTLVIAFFAIITGVGSFAFHTFANGWSYWADVGPILLFQATLFSFCMKYVFQLHVGAQAFWLVLYMALTIGFGFSPFKAFMNGSLSYVPSLVFLLFVFLKERQVSSSLAARSWIAWGFGLFVVSITARSFDMAVCESWPLGTHFIWHLVNGPVLFALILFAGEVTARRSSAQ